MNDENRPKLPRQMLKMSQREHIGHQLKYASSEQNVNENSGK